ncbi:MAG: 2-amino-4-hydroxy-6-hydroxymethyldihydropteridine diphosphokinase [Gemmatimonadetes bacterium]|nr:2-amino-4-hydroxy-6-hydroxymethyldihydropteridine diphosphokinase [Gemmatimonadota bacterium]
MNASEDFFEAFLGMGSNLDRPLEQLREAVRRVGAFAEVLEVSSVYRSEPVGFRDQPDFLNLVCRVRTALPPHEFLAALHRVEAEGGRVRSFRDAPRLIDVDLLAYGGVVADTPELMLPHPRMTRRAFVLVPLAEIAPEWRHPVLGRTARELLSDAGALERIERLGALPG